jgi:hypothetical protein
LQQGVHHWRREGVPGVEKDSMQHIRINRGIASGALLATLAGMSSLFAQESAIYRINCGGEAFVDKAKHFWAADGHYEGGQTFFADSAIVNTDIPNLYQTERWNDVSVGNLKYTFEVRAGDYKVNLHFAEVYDVAFATGKRVFDVVINGSTVTSDLDVFAQAGARAPLIIDYLVTAASGKVTIELMNKVGNAKISGIEVLPRNPPRAATVPYRIRCGGDDYIDPKGNWWEGDGHFTGGNVYVSTHTVGGTDMSMLYQAERFGEAAYSFDVPEGSYDIALHFAEVFFQTAGQRVFSVDINGASAIENLDVLSEAGANTALIKTFTVPAVGGKITIGLRNGIENAKISAIEIMPAGTVRNRVARALPSLPEVTVKSMKPGSLSLESASGAPFSAMVRDSRGKAVAGLNGTASGSISGLRSGLFLVEVREGARKAAYRVIVR